MTYLQTIGEDLKSKGYGVEYDPTPRFSEWIMIKNGVSFSQCRFRARKKTPHIIELIASEMFTNSDEDRVLRDILRTVDLLEPNSIEEIYGLVKLWFTPVLKRQHDIF